MDSKISQYLWRSLTAFALISFVAMGVAAQQIDDPDPNSPTPVLNTQADSIRVLAVPAGGKIDVKQARDRAFALNSDVTLFVSNVSLRQGEGAAAFRVYAIDGQGHEFRFPVLSFQPAGFTRGVYAVTIRLSDEIGYWQLRENAGDVIVYLTWRGLASNQARLGIGQVGGDVTPAPDSRPMPIGSRAVNTGGTNSPDSPDYVGYRWSGDRSRFLEQATFGPNPMNDLMVRRLGLKIWLNQQFDAPYPSTANPYPSQPLKPGNAPTDCDNNQTIPDVPVTCFRDTYTMYQPQTWFMREALYSDAQLRHRVAWALAQIWVNSGVDIQQGRHIVEYHKILSNNAFGNYRTLMKQMTLSPTMGDYLSMALSTRTNPNENYAREIMQLFSVGLFMLNQDGSVQCIENNPCQPGDTPKPTYDQTVVNDMTRVFTGWSFCSVPASCPNLTIGTVNFIDPMLLNPGVTTLNNNRHDLNAKTLLNYTGSASTMNIAACGSPCAQTPNATGLANIQTYANNSMDQALDNIFNHPNVGPYVSKILIQHMITSDPTPQYVSDIAGVFNNNGFGVRGDLKAVVKAILLHPEARGDVKTDPHFGKLREPVMFATNIMRAFNPRSADSLSQSDGFFTGRAEFNGMAQVPFLSPTVFNYYPPDYIVPGTAMLGPEFAILTTGTSIQRANFVNRFVFSAPAVPGGTTDAPFGTSLDFNDLAALAQQDLAGDLLLDELNRRMLHLTMSSQMRSTIKTAIQAYGSTTSTDFLNRARQAVYLVATSSQYQVQR